MRIALVVMLLLSTVIQSIAVEKKGPLMDSILVTIEEKAEMYLVGITEFGSPGKMNIGNMWGRMKEIEKTIPEQVENDGEYGLMIYPPWRSEKREFTYLASVRVKNLDVIPIQLLAKKLPKCKYAKFSVLGGPDKIKDTYQFAYGTWLPRSEYEPAYPFDFEFYKSEDGKPSCSSPIYVYIPIKEKAK